jgi:hypothetical protein
VPIERPLTPPFPTKALPIAHIRRSAACPTPDRVFINLPLVVPIYSKHSDHKYDQTADDNPDLSDHGCRSRPPGAPGNAAILIQEQDRHSQGADLQRGAAHCCECGEAAGTAGGDRKMNERFRFGMFLVLFIGLLLVPLQAFALQYGQFTFELGVIGITVIDVSLCS